MTMYSIFVDLPEALEDVYPGLSLSEMETLAQAIHEGFDYSLIYDEILEMIESVAAIKGIKLDGKDGIETDRQRDEIYDDVTDPYGGP